MMRALAMSVERTFPTERKSSLMYMNPGCVFLVALRWVQSGHAAVTPSEAWMGLSCGMETQWYAGPDPEVPRVPYWSMLLFFFSQTNGEPMELCKQGN